MGIVYTKENGTVGIDKDGEILFGRCYNLPVVKTNAMPKGKIVYMSDDDFIVVTDDAVYVSDYKEVNYCKILEGKRYKNLKVYTIDGKIMEIVPNISTMSYKDKRKKNSLNAIVRDNVDTPTIFLYRGEKVIVTMDYDYDEFKDSINSGILFSNGYKPTYAFKYKIVSKDGNVYSGIKPTLSSIAAEVGYTSSFLSMIKNGRYPSRKIEIIEVING